MRLLQTRWTRLLALWIGILALFALAAACAGDRDSTRGSGVVPSSAEAAHPDSPGDILAAPQATDEPPLAARVNGQPITLEQFERERDRWMIGLTIEPASQVTFDASVLDAMIDQVLIAQAAQELGITVSEEEIDAELALHADIAQTNDTTLEEVISAQLYTMDEYRTVVANLLLVQKVSEVVAQVPEVAPQVHARHILVADEATARALLNQLQAGADFAQLATQYSLDATTAPSGGDLGWVSQGVLLQSEVEAAIFGLQPGQIASDPVQSSLGYHIVQTLERVEDRPLSQAAIAQRRQQLFLEWLETLRENAVIERFVGLVE